MENVSSILRAGVTEETLIAAIKSSGHPTQSIVADKLRSALSHTKGPAIVQEEWSFEDTDQKIVRQLDAWASKSLRDVSDANPYDPHRPTEMRSLLRYELDLFVECKHSELPYVFFLRDGGRNTSVPRIWGFPHEHIKYGKSIDRLNIDTPTTDFVADHGQDYADGMPVAVSVSKAHRKGGGLELSGEEVFRSLTLPVLKAVDYFRDQTISESKLYRDIRFLAPIVVLEAPIVGVRLIDGEPTVEALNAVRLSVTRPRAESKRYEGSNQVLGVDFVGVDFMDEYVRSMIDRIRIVAERIDRFAPTIMTGKAIYGPDGLKSVSTGEPHCERFVSPITKEEEAAIIASEFTKVHSSSNGSVKIRQTRIQPNS